MHRAWTVFAVMSATYCLSQFYRLSTALIAVDLVAEFDLGPEQLSLLGAVFFYVFALAQIPLGPILDRWGAKTVVMGSTVVAALGSLTFAASSGWAGLLLGRGLIGLGMAPVLMGSLKLIAAWFPAGAFGTVSGLILSLGMGGALLAATPLAAVVARLGWRGTFVAFGCITLAAALSIGVLVRDREDPPEDTAGGGGSLAGWGRVLAAPNLWVIAPLALVGYASVASLQSLWAGPYFMNALGYSRTETGNILFALGLTMALGGVVGGWLSDRVLRSRKWVVAAGNAVTVLCLVPLVGVAQPAHPSGWMGLFSFLGFFSAFRVLLYAHVKESVPRRHLGTAVTAVNFFIMVGPAVLQQAIGLALRTWPGRYTTAFWVPLGSLILGSAVYLFSRDTHPSRPR